MAIITFIDTICRFFSDFFNEIYIGLELLTAHCITSSQYILQNTLMVTDFVQTTGIFGNDLVLCS